MINLNGDIIFQNKNNIDIYYKPPKESLLKTSKGDIALFTSTEVNKVYALINLNKFSEIEKGEHFKVLTKEDSRKFMKIPKNKNQININRRPNL